jgi:hypothetical protein
MTSKSRVFPPADCRHRRDGASGERLARGLGQFRQPHEEPDEHGISHLSNTG